MRRKRGVVTQSVICSIMPLAFLDNGMPVYPIMGAEGSDDDGDDGDDGDEEDPDADADGDDKDEESKKKPKPKRRTGTETDAQKIRRLNAENKERRERAEKLEAEARAREDKEKTDLEIAVRDAKDFQAKHSQAEKELMAAKVENAFLKFKDGKTKYEWEDPELVLDILNSKYELTLADDGTVEGLAEAIKELAKNKPFLLVKADGSEGDRDTRTRQTQGPSGGASGGRRSSGGKEQAERNKLLNNYPVLSQGVPIQ